MTKKFSNLRSLMKPESQSRSQGMTEQLLAEISLRELRRARALLQRMLSEVLNLQQPFITKFEKHADMYLSLLRTHIQALGGDLEIIARFPHGTVIINSFSDLENELGTGSINDVGPTN